jgi:translation initiation factor 5A
MSSLDDYDFEGGDAGASTTYPMEAGQIRKGGHIVIKGRPCKVANVSVSKTGKHGHAKCNFTAIDIFTGRKYEDIVPSTHGTSVPNVSRADFTLVDIGEDGFLSLMDDDGELKEDLQLPDYPEELAGQVREAFESGQSLILTVLSAMDHEQIIAFKEDTD